MTPWPHGDPNTVAREILAQPAYRQPPAVADPSASWWQMALDFIGKWLQRLFHNVHLPARAIWSATEMLGIVLLVLAGLGLAVLVYRVLAGLRRTARDPLRAAHVPLGADGGALDVRTAARAAAQRGDYAGAIGLVFRAALFALDAGGAIGFDPARTPGEYRRLVRARAGVATVPFDELSVRFVRASFAAQTPERADFDAAWLALVRLDAALEVTESSAA